MGHNFFKNPHFLLLKQLNLSSLFYTTRGESELPLKKLQAKELERIARPVI